MTKFRAKTLSVIDSYHEFPTHSNLNVIHHPISSTQLYRWGVTQMGRAFIKKTGFSRKFGINPPPTSTYYDKHSKFKSKIELYIMHEDTPLQWFKAKAKELNQDLTDVDELIFRGFWQNLSYKEIYRLHRQEIDNLVSTQKAGIKVLRLLKRILGQDISKADFRYQIIQISDNEAKEVLLWLEDKFASKGLKKFNDLERDVFLQIWYGKAYKEMTSVTRVISVDHLMRNVGPSILRRVGLAIEEKITKHYLRVLVKEAFVRDVSAKNIIQEGSGPDIIYSGSGPIDIGLPGPAISFKTEILNDSIDIYQPIRVLLNARSLKDIVSASQYIDRLRVFSLDINPQLTEFLAVLYSVSKDIQIYALASSQVNQLTALIRANNILQSLAESLFAERSLMESTALLDVAQHWSEIITDSGGVIIQDVSLQPVPNPYVVGNPVSGQLFVGRDDILARIEELWMPSGQLPSIILYGHRRMGKTSILQNLQGHLGPHTTLIDFNLQRIGMVHSSAELLHNLALALYDSLPTSTDLPEPNETTFTNHNPYTAFDRFLKKLNPHRGQTRYIIALDEFELLEQRIQENRLDPELLTYFRSLINSYPWFILALAGLHNLQEMTHDYWSPLFGNVTPIHVSFLTEKAADRLITNPSDDFPIDYTPDAIAEIYSLTGGQPYLIQLICHNLVSRYNYQRFEANQDIEPRFTLPDVQTIINSPTFFSQGHAYFSGIWSQASEQQGPTQQAILRALSYPEPEVERLQDIQLLDPAAYDEAIALLIRHDIIQHRDGQYHYVVELMCRWVQATQTTP